MKRKIRRVKKHLLSFQEEVNKNGKWLRVAGILLILCGSLLYVNCFSIFPMADFLPALIFLFTAFIFLMHSFRFWYRKLIGFSLSLFACFLYGGLGFFFIFYQSIALPYFLSPILFLFMMYYLLVGFFRMNMATSQKLKHGWSWTFYCSLVNLISVILLLFGIYTFPLFSLIFSSANDIFFSGIALWALGRK